MSKDELISIGIIVKNSFLMQDLEKLESTVSKLNHNIEIIIIAVDTNAENSALLIKAIRTMQDTTILFVKNVCDSDMARTIIFDNAVGDRILLTSLKEINDILWNKLISEAQKGYDIVMSKCSPDTKKNSMTLIRNLFLKTYRGITKLPVVQSMPETRIYSRDAALHILSRSERTMLLKCTDLGTGFPVKIIDDEKMAQTAQTTSLPAGLKKAWLVLQSTNSIPLRLVVFLSFVGAFLNILYATYVGISWLFIDNLQPGWVTQSLQSSGMFFILTIILGLIGEHMILIEKSVNHRLQYSIIRELRSNRSRHEKKVNVVEA